MKEKKREWEKRREAIYRKIISSSLASATCAQMINLIDHLTEVEDLTTD
jgi:hypothetical protein